MAGDTTEKGADERVELKEEHIEIKEELKIEGTKAGGTDGGGSENPAFDSQEQHISKSEANPHIDSNKSENNENVPNNENTNNSNGDSNPKDIDTYSYTLEINNLDTRLDIVKETNNNLAKDNQNVEQEEKNVIDDLKRPRKMSNYLQNITNSSLGLTLSGDKKGTILLSDSKTIVRFSPLWIQALASAAAILLTFVSGLTSGYSAILLPQLKDSNGPIPHNQDTDSWIAAMAVLPMAPGCLIAGWMMEKYGRRTSLYITCLPMFLGWIFIACSYNLSLMLFGRFLTGLCTGLLGPLTPVYIGETTEPKYRGFFLAGVSLAIAVGILVVQLIGTFASWQWTAIICCIFPLISLVLLTLIPESPTWLISKGRHEDAAKAFYWLRGYGEDAKLELKGILDSQKSNDEEPKMNWKEKILSLKNPEFIKPLMIMIIFFVTCQFSGVNAVAFYSIDIVEKAVGKGIDHYAAMLIIDALRVAMSVVACVLSKRYGRRPLCFISGIWTAISMAGLSMFLYWKPEDMSWLPLSCLLFYICAISIGLVPLPWIMCGEVFPTRVRGLGSGISSATTFIAFFTVVKTAPGMMSNLGEVFTFLFYGVISLIGTIIMYFILPETKGKSLQEIEDKFKNRKNSSPKV